MVSRFIRVSTQNIVDEYESRNYNEHFDPRNPGKLQDVNMNFPNTMVDDPDAADSIATEWRIEGERGFNLGDLTEQRQDEANELSPYNEFQNAYTNPNDYEDPDLHLGERLAYLRPGDEPGKLVVVIPIPEPFSDKFPSEADGKENKAHITVLYLGQTPPERFAEVDELVATIANDHPPLDIKFKIGVEYFTNKEDQRIAHKGIEAPGLEELHNELKAALKEAGFEVKAYDTFKPHATLAYGPVGDQKFEYTGEVPEGGWICQELEIWGTGESTPLIDFNGLKMVAQKRDLWLAVDLDNTVLSQHDMKNRMPSGQPGFGEPLPGAIEALGTLLDLGHRVSIFTARFGDSDDPRQNDDVEAEIQDYLDSAGIPYSDIWVGNKPRSDYFIDDKAIHFDGNWPDIVKLISTEDTKEGVAVIDTTDSGNEFIDPFGSRRDLSIPRAPTLERITTKTGGMCAELTFSVSTEALSNN